MAVTKETIDKYDVELVTKWNPPEDGDLRALIAMPNIPKPCHGQAPRTLLGRKKWDQMRKTCYKKAQDTCEICGEKPTNLRHRHAHEVYEIDYEKGEVKFVRAFCICALCHLGGIHTGRAITLYKQGNPLYPKKFLLDGAEHSFRLISEYNKDHPEARIKAYSTFLDYLKVEELKKPMEDLIKIYGIEFYQEDPKKMAKWEDWGLIINGKKYPTPYKNEKDWKAAMDKQGKKDSARKLQSDMEKRFSGGAYDELNKILEENKLES